MYKRVPSYLIAFSIFFNQVAFCGIGASRETITEDDPLLTRKAKPRNLEEGTNEKDVSAFEGNFDIEVNRGFLPYSQRSVNNEHLDYNTSSALLRVDIAENGSLESELVLSHKVREWLEKDILNPENQLSKGKTIIIDGIGVYSGLSRGSVYFMLGYDLAERITSITHPGNIVFSSIYGAGVAFPMTVLGLETSGDFIKKILKKKSISENKIEMQENKYWKFTKVGSKIVIGVVSLISASTITYLTYYEFHGYIGLFWLIPGIPNFYTKAAMDYVAIPTVMETLYNEIKRPIDRFFGNKLSQKRAKNITSIKDKLDQACNYIFSFTDEQAQNFLNAFLKSDDDLVKITMLMKPHLFENIVNVKKRNSWGRKLFGAVGGAIGIVGLWMYLPATEEAFRTLLPNISPGLDTPQLVEALAYITLLSASSIMSLASASSTAKFYDSIAHFTSNCGSKSQKTTQSPQNICWTQEVKRVGAGITSTLLALWNASQAIDVTLDFLDIHKVSSKFILVSSFFSFFSLSFWSVDEKFSKYLKSSDCRAPLLGKLDLIKQKIIEMTDDCLDSLEMFLESNERMF